MHYKHRLYSAWPQVEDSQVLTNPETLLSVIQVARFNSFCNAVYLLGQHDEMPSHRQQFYKEHFCRAIRNHTVDIIKVLPRSPWIPLQVLCAPTLSHSFKCAYVSNACNWDSSLEACLEAPGAASFICHLELEVSWEWTLDNDWWERGVCEGNKKVQSLHFCFFFN